MTSAMIVQSVRHIVVLLMLMLVPVSMLSCIPFISRHENYKDIMQRDVGRSIDDPNTLVYIVANYEPHLLMESKILENGNVENKYRYRIRTCRTFFEYNPETRIIVSWRFEGEENDCYITP